MIDLNTPHGELLGLPDSELKILAGTATHQHFKGGLYRLIGPVIDVETGRQLRMPESAQVAIMYEHLYPHERKIYARGEFEMTDMVEWEAKCIPGPNRLVLNKVFGGRAFIHRFRQLGRKWHAEA